MPDDNVTSGALKGSYGVFAPAGYSTPRLKKSKAVTLRFACQAGLTLCLGWAASQADPAHASPQSAASNGGERIARAIKASTDALPPVLLDAFAAICVPVVEHGANLETAARELLPDQDKSASTLPGMQWTWVQRNLEFVMPQRLGETGSHRDLGTYANLHAGIDGSGVCTVAYEILDTEVGGDPQDYAKRVYQWIGTLDDFTEAESGRDGARWVDAKKGIALSMSSNDDDVIFIHYHRL